MSETKKGITVKIDAGLHAEVRQYVEQHGMTMAEFVALALEDELHPKYNQKEEKNMGNMRTLAFQVPEELFQRIKGYLQRNNITQKQFVLGLIETELDREQNEREGMCEEAAEPQENSPVSDCEAVSEETEEVYEEQDSADLSGDCEADSEEYENSDESETEAEAENEVETEDEGEDEEEIEDETETEDEAEAEDEDETEGLIMGGM